MKTGARALRSIMENIMLDVMYDLPAQDEPVRVTINASVVRGKGKAKVVPIPQQKGMLLKESFRVKSERSPSCYLQETDQFH